MLNFNYPYLSILGRIWSISIIFIFPKLVWVQEYHKVVLNNLVIYLVVIEISSKAKKKISFFRCVSLFLNTNPVWSHHHIFISVLQGPIKSCCCRWSPAIAPKSTWMLWIPCGFRRWERWEKSIPLTQKAWTLTVILLVFNGEISETPRSDSWGLIHVPWVFLPLNYAKI